MIYAAGWAGNTQNCALEVVVAGATVRIRSRRHNAIVATPAAIIALCWLLFTFAVFALPYFAGVIVGFWAYDTGSGIIGGVIVGAVAGAATFVLFRLLLLVTRPTWMTV